MECAVFVCKNKRKQLSPICSCRMTRSRDMLVCFFVIVHVPFAVTIGGTRVSRHRLKFTDRGNTMAVSSCEEDDACM
jgi:hypothetical protein